VLEDARAEGEALGIAKGKAEGKAEGEAAAKVQMVRAMHASGLDLVQIAQITGLSRQQIDDLLVP
jgi:predicted transposase/invertase (TIGR01784 family)